MYSTYIYIHIYIYIYIYIVSQSFKYDTGTKIIMSSVLTIKKNSFPDTHRHFRLAIEISGKCPIVCGGLKLKVSNFIHKCLDSQPKRYQ